jgi:peptidoglycan/xylan/chitin deacetylase (PgdA/CDA1 family)
MKTIRFKKTISVFLILVMIFSFASCAPRDTESSASDSLSSELVSIDTSAASDESSSDVSSTSSEASEDSSEVMSESESEPTSEESSSVSSAESSETSSEESSAASSEEPSSQPGQSEDSSSSPDDVSVLNPYYGTDIKPAEGKVIAFTFDDGPSYTDSTNIILDKLEELGMGATFFMVGNRVSAQAAPTIKRMIELGCDLGNHSYDHPNFNSMSVSEVKKQIDDTNARLEKYVGVKSTLIRPPYGNIKDAQMASLHTPIICWDIDTLDWQFRADNLKTHSKKEIAQMIYDHTMKRVHSGGIVLMHDIYDTTAEAFCMLADELVAQGYTLVTVSELLGTEKLMCTTVKYGFKW